MLLASTAWGQIDRSAAPGPGPAPEIAIGDYTVETLENGLKLIVVENHRLPRVSWNLSLDFDPALEGDKIGTASFTGQLMKAGTPSRSKSQIDEAVDFIGGRLSTSSGGAFASSLTKHMDAILELMSDVVLNPSFPEEELEKLREQTLSNLVASETDPGSISGNLRSTVLYSENHPYGEVETPETISAITREDLTAFHSTYFRPNIAYLVVVGDITESEWQLGFAVPLLFGSLMIISITNRAGIVAAVVGAVVAVLGADLPQGSGVLLAIVLGVVAGGIADARREVRPPRALRSRPHSSPARDRRGPPDTARDVEARAASWRRP